VLGARSIASLAAGGGAVPVRLAEGGGEAGAGAGAGEGGGGDGDDASAGGEPPLRRLLAFCPLRRREVQWLALTAYADVLSRAEAVARGVPAALRRVRAAVAAGALRCGGGVALGEAAGAGGSAGAEGLLRSGARVGAARPPARPPTERALRRARARMRACAEGAASSPLLPLLRLDEGSADY
jgi:hypothetical protein